MQSVSPTVFVYHSPCMDGYACAYIAWLHGERTGTEYEFVGTGPGSSPPCPASLQNRHVIFADVCWSKHQMDHLHEVSASLLVIDHHETNQKALAGASYAKFDMTKSACMLVWEHFFPNEKIPDALYYIGLRDIWQHENNLLANAFTTACPDQSFFESFVDFQFFITSNIGYTIAEGTAMIKYKNQMLTQMASKATAHIWHVDGKQVDVMMINACWPWTSDLGNMLCNNHPMHVAMLWTKRPGEPFNVSLRSHKDGPNVAELAERMGGGGHRNAAAFRMEKLPETLFFAHEAGGGGK